MAKARRTGRTSNFSAKTGALAPVQAAAAPAGLTVLVPALVRAVALVISAAPTGAAAMAIVLEAALAAVITRVRESNRLEWR